MNGEASISGAAAGEKVAVIVVHGVADQKRGDTVAQVVEQLLAQSPEGARYGPATHLDVVLAVEPLAPASKVAPAKPNVLQKRLMQSVRSDFLRSGQVHNGKALRLAPDAAVGNPDTAFTDYLLKKSIQNDQPRETYTAAEISVERIGAGSRTQLDFFEMYWADLSRLSGSVPRILTELFTLLFRLSVLGRDTVQAAATRFGGEIRAWQFLEFLQTALDWLYSRVIAILALQLLMSALMIVPFGYLANLGSEPGWHVQYKVASFVYAAVSAALVLSLAYLTRRWLLCITVCAFLCATFVALLEKQIFFVLLASLFWFIFLSIIYDWAMRTFEERFRSVRLTGWIIWLIHVGWILTAVLCAKESALDSGPFYPWLAGALAGVELVLSSFIKLWIFAGVGFLLWLLAGCVAWRSCTGKARLRALASVTTGRLGLIVSIGFFLALTMSAWALLHTATTSAVRDLPYMPWVESFKDVTPYQRRLCTLAEKMAAESKYVLKESKPVECGEAPLARSFLGDRFEKSTTLFAAIGIVLLCLVGYSVAGLGPSILAELKVANWSSIRLGTWLTGCYRYGTGVLAAVSGAGVFLFVLAALDFSHNVFDLPGWPVFECASGLVVWFEPISASLLKPLIITAGTLTAVLTALGGVLSRYVPGLRAPLDVALDVDNYLREFPRSAIPRARIFSRYYALLRHIDKGKYDRVVVVAHSQGTVITVDLFRYLSQRADADEWWKVFAAKTRLMTVGCPLRQLYAAHFPVLCGWVLESRQAAGGKPVCGPDVNSLGLATWVNLYTSGDYVGRWLWTLVPPAKDDPALYERTARGYVYFAHGGRISSGLQGLMQGADHVDSCASAGAHTHYFDKEVLRGRDRLASEVASTVDLLVSAS